MSALPWFKFYPSDWQADTALRMVSLSARGLWIGMLCVMDGADPRGHLVWSGRALAADDIAKLLGCDARETRKSLDELERAGVFDRAADGAIISRKMVRDTRFSREQSARASKRDYRKAAKIVEEIAFGNAGQDAENMPQIPEPEPDSMSSPGGEDSSEPVVKAKPAKSRVAPAKPSATEAEVDAIWAATPKPSRERSGRADVARALTAAMSRGHTAAQVTAGLAAYFATDDATREEARFAKGVHRMIESDRWQSFAPAAAASMPESRWKHALAYWNRDGSWDDKWGPKPGEPGCQAPAHMLLRVAA